MENELSEEEKALIRRHKTFYKSLANGSRSPTTEAQKHFIDVVHGKKTAITNHEIAYTKFLSQLKRNQETYRRAKDKVKRKSDKTHIKDYKPTQSNKKNADRNIFSKPPLSERLQNAPPIDKSKFEYGGFKSEPVAGARYIDEPLGTREDFKKDSGRNWNRSTKPKF